MPNYRQTRDYYAAEARGEALPERHLPDIDRPAVEYRRDGRRKIKGFTTAQRAASMRRFRGQEPAETTALRSLLSQRRAQAGLPQSGQPTAQERVTKAADRKQQLMKSGWSPAQADDVMAKEDAAKESKTQSMVDNFSAVEEGTRTLNRNSPLAKLPPGEMERQPGEVYRKPGAPKQEYSKTWFQDRLMAGRKLAMAR